MRKHIPVLYLVLFFLILSAIPVHAQSTEKQVYSAERTNESEGSPPDFFIAPLVEVLGYSRKGPAFGGGLAVGAGSGVAIGLRLFYAIDTESINTLEIAVFMRFYLQGPDACTGLFVQLNAGASIFDYESAATPPAEAGDISLGIAVGWRFLLGSRWYLEPAVRLGYPYIGGLGVSIAYRL